MWLTTAATWACHSAIDASVYSLTQRVWVRRLRLLYALLDQSDRPSLQEHVTRDRLFSEHLAMVSAAKLVFVFFFCTVGHVRRWSRKKCQSLKGSAPAAHDDDDERHPHAPLAPRTEKGHSATRNGSPQPTNCLKETKGTTEGHHASRRPAH